MLQIHIFINTQLFSWSMCLFRLNLWEKYEWINHLLLKCKFKKLTLRLQLEALLSSFDYITILANKGWFHSELTPCRDWAGACTLITRPDPDSKVHGAHLRLSDLYGPHICPMNLTIRGVTNTLSPEVIYGRQANMTHSNRWRSIVARAFREGSLSSIFILSHECFHQ